jgi:hypothetical protein
MYNFKCFVTAPRNDITCVSGGLQEFLPSGKEAEEEEKQLFYSLFRGKVLKFHQ